MSQLSAISIHAATVPLAQQSDVRYRGKSGHREATLKQSRMTHNADINVLGEVCHFVMFKQYHLLTYKAMRFSQHFSIKGEPDDFFESLRKLGSLSPSPVPPQHSLLVWIRKLQIANSLQGKMLRRWIFLCRFIAAKRNTNTIQRLEPILAKSFEHEWIAGVGVGFRFWPGAEDRELRIPWSENKFLLRLRVLPWRKQGCPADWGAPITVTVSKKGQDETTKTVRYMSLFLKGGVLHIVQLQGVPLIEMPKGLRDPPLHR
jgi:hypothetical protein